jgi:hypothetical protein
MNSAQPRRNIHLVGSIGLGSAEDVFRAVSTIIGDRVIRIPDGETGARSSWIHWNRAVFEDNPALEPDPVEKAAGRRLTSDRGHKAVARRAVTATASRLRRRQA